MSPVTEEAITIAPLPSSSMYGMAAWQVFHTPLMLTSMWKSRVSSVISSNGARRQTPAFAAGHVKGAEGLLGLGGRVDHLLLVGHVGHDGDDLGVRVYAADALGGLVHVRVEVDHADLRAVLDVRLRNALAESGCGAGDDGDLAFELALNHGDNSFVC